MGFESLHMDSTFGFNLVKWQVAYHTATQPGRVLAEEKKSPIPSHGNFHVCWLHFIYTRIWSLHVDG